jgi:hypothetical protein
MSTEARGRARTQKALDTLTQWGKNPSSNGGEIIGFSLSRQGAPSEVLVVMGDCTPFTPAGARGTLSGQPAGNTGAPIGYRVPAPDAIPCTFSFDLNAGKVSLAGAFPGLPPSLSFTVEYMNTFDAAGGKNLLFHSEKASDQSGYVLTIQHVGEKLTKAAPVGSDVVARYGNWYKGDDDLFAHCLIMASGDVVWLMQGLSVVTVRRGSVPQDSLRMLLDLMAALPSGWARASYSGYNFITAAEGAASNEITVLGVAANDPSKTKTYYAADPSSGVAAFVRAIAAID